MDHLKAMRVFCRVVDEGSFAAAARALQIAPAAVTRLVADLEEHLGARLLNRTTRRIALTDTGELYLERVRQILADLDDAEVLAAASTTEPRGHLRVLVPPAFAVHQIAKHLPAFRARYPRVTVELKVPPAVETVDEGYDVSLVTLFNDERLDGDFIVRRLARSELIMCAAPEYLDRRGRIVHPHDVGGHDVILPAIASVQRQLTCHSQRGETVTIVPPPPVLVTSHLDTAYAAALQGLGIAGLPSFMVEDALLERALERVAPGWRLSMVAIHAGMPSRKHLPARTRAFVDFLVETFGGEPRDPWLAASGCETQPAAELSAA